MKLARGTGKATLPGELQVLASPITIWSRSPSEPAPSGGRRCCSRCGADARRAAAAAARSTIRARDVPAQIDALPAPLRALEPSPSRAAVAAGRLATASSPRVEAADAKRSLT